MSRLFDTTGFPPRWLCGSGWTPLHGYTHIVADLLVFGAYVAIPIALMFFLWKRGNDIPFPRIGWLFVIFIMACGTTHLLDAMMFYWPAYRILAAAKVITAVASCATVVAIFQILPQALNLPSRLKVAESLEEEIARQQRLEQMTREKAEFTRVVLDSLPEAIAVLDGDGRIVTVNEVWRQQSSELHPAGGDPQLPDSGQNYLTATGVVFPTDPRSEQAITERLERLLAEGISFSAEYRTKIPSTGQSRWILMRAAPLQTSQKGAVVSHHDITSRKQVEAALVEARAAADAASESKSRFLANMSHEIRTPMTAVLGYADLLAEELNNPAHLESVDLLRRHGRFLLEILDDILDLSKIEAGKLEVEAVECSLVSLIGDVESLMQVRAAEKGVKLSVEYDGGVPVQIRTDPVRLRQILTNLIGNALKFTEEGHVRLVVRHLPQGTLAGRSTGPDHDDSSSRLASSSIIPLGPGKVLFEVHDTGIGMSSDQTARLFRAFTQADASTTRKYGGTGLGLAICRNLATMLGGRIWVDSELDKGSVFAFTIASDVGHPVLLISPEDAEAVRPQPPPPEIRAARLDGLRILLTEDTPGLRHLVSRILTLAGATITPAENGREAIQAVEAAGNDSFDLILMDVQMPEVNGFDATRRIRQLGFTAPIVALTAGAMAGDREKCLAAGCDGYVPKPIDRGELLRTIATLTGNTSGGNTLAGNTLTGNTLTGSSSSPDAARS